MEKKYKLIIICSALALIIISLILSFMGFDKTEKGKDVIEKAIDIYCESPSEYEDVECIDENKEAIKEELEEVYPYGSFGTLGEGILYLFLGLSHFFNLIFFIILIILFATSSARICRTVLFIFLIIFLSISLLISIQFVTWYTKTEVDLNDDELYIFDDELNKQLKEVLDDLIVRLLYYFFSLICVCLAYIGCIVLLIFNIKDKDERK